MCAIAGFVGNLNRQDLHLMLERMAHRGRDGSGIFFQDGIGLGNNRLAVIGRRSGKQPIQSQDGRLTMTFNGEIYNYKEIKRGLKRKGYVFKTTTDTEVVLNAYAEYGVKCLSMFNGMFAFAIWDSRKGRLFMARDRVGIKPLFYTLFQNSFIFSSELKGLTAISIIKPDINYQSIYYYLKLKYVPEPQTMIREIYHLLPGHYLIYRPRGKVILAKYWDMDNLPKLEVSLDEAEKLLEDKLISSIERHLSSEIPLGIFASGGIDSGLISVIASRFKKNIPVFHISFKNDRFDESRHAEFLSREISSRFHSLTFRDDWVSRLPKIVWHLDQPLADPAIIPTFFLSEFAAKQVGVILTGDGADEIFAGYRRYKYLRYLEKMFYNPLSDLFRLPDLYNLYLSGNLFSDDEIKKLLTKNLLNKFNLSFDGWRQKNQALIGDDYLNRMLKTDLLTWLPGDILLKTDRMTMAHTLEARVPYLNHEIIEFGLSLKPEFKINGLTDKVILRKLGKKILPEQISTRQKHGFDIPMPSLISFAKSVLTQEKTVGRGWFNYKYIPMILQQAYTIPRRAKQVMSLLMLELWSRAYLDH